MFQIHDALFEDQQKQIKRAIQLAESSNDALLKELLVDSPFFHFVDMVLFRYL